MTVARAIPRPAVIATLAPFYDTPRMTELRSRLSTARDLATQAIGRWQHHSEAARRCYLTISETATSLIAARATEDELSTARHVCLLLLQAASILDEMETTA
jgi:hypothetical protein